MGPQAWGKPELCGGDFQSGGGPWKAPEGVGQRKAYGGPEITT